MENEKLYKFLSEIMNNGIAKTYDKGNEWFCNEFIPAIKQAEKISILNKELLSDLWYFVGDIHDFNEAPLKAIEAYQKSIFFDNENAASYREIANRLISFGNYDEALININKSLELNPTEQCAIQDKKDIVFYKDSIALYNENDIVFKMRELLANQEFDNVTITFANSTEIEELKILARAYGGLGLTNEYLVTWNKIALLNLRFEIEYPDWFYMPKKVNESKEIWLIFKAINIYIEKSVFVYSDGLLENYKDTYSHYELRALMCDFKIYSIENNLQKLKLLKEKYPLWIELNEFQV